MKALQEAIQSALSQASRDEEYMTLAGITPADLADCDTGEVPRIGYVALESVLHDGLAQLAALRSHEHQWDYGETENDPVRCVVCGADGLA